jgi:hypothetical protein
VAENAAIDLTIAKPPGSSSDDASDDGNDGDVGVHNLDD